VADPPNPAWLGELSASFDKIGDLLVAEGDLGEALKSYRDGLAIRAQVSKANPANAAHLSATDFVMPNSDRVLSTIDVGFSTIVWSRTILNVTAQFGITGHVPDFRLITSLPIRF
jgi:hypothetical protein